VTGLHRPVLRCRYICLGQMIVNEAMQCRQIDQGGGIGYVPILPQTLTRSGHSQ
jgi:hypothetical protein